MNPKSLLILLLVGSAVGPNAAWAMKANPVARWQWHAGLIISTRSRVDDIVYGKPSFGGSISVSRKPWTFSLNATRTGDGNSRRTVSRLAATYAFPVKIGRFNYAMGIADYGSNITPSLWQRLAVAKQISGVDFNLGLSYQARDFDGNRNVSGVQAGIGHRFSKNLNLSAGLGAYYPGKPSGYQSRYVSLSYNLTPNLSMTSTLSSLSRAETRRSANSILSFSLNQKIW